MSCHKGITCDVCLKENFVGIRYKCLACRNYDLCATCYNECQQSHQHLTNHPVQAILTPPDFEVFFGYEANKSDKQYQSLTCSYCGTMGYSNIQLHDHILTEHSSSSTPVICPLCAVLDGGSVSFVESLSTHMALSHPELHESANSARSGRHRAHYAPCHGVWTTMPSNSRRADFSSLPSEILSSRNRDSLLSHLSNLRGSFVADELLSLELQLPDGNRRMTGLPYEQLMTSEDLRLFYDPLLIPLTSGEQTTSSALNTTLPSAECSSHEQHDAEPSFLLTELEKERTEQEKEIREAENADRSVFIQELFLSTIFEPREGENSDELHNTNNEPINKDETSLDNSHASVRPLVTRSSQSLLVEPAQNKNSITPSSPPIAAMLTDGRTVSNVLKRLSSSSSDASEKATSLDSML